MYLQKELYMESVYIITKIQFRYPAIPKNIQEMKRAIIPLVHFSTVLPLMYQNALSKHTSQLHIGKNFYLPFQIEAYTIKEYRLKKETVSMEAAAASVKEKLSRYIGNLQEKGVQIIENNVKITNSGDECLAEGDITVRQLIGIPHELQIISEEQTLE